MNFKHFAGFKLHSVYHHSPKFQSLISLRIKVMFFPNMLQMTLQTSCKIATYSKTFLGISLILAVIAASVHFCFI